MKTAVFCFVLLVIAAFAQVSVQQPAIAPSACAWPPGVTTGVAHCGTTNPVSPDYVALNGGAFQPTSVPAGSVTSVNGRVGAVQVPNASTLQCTSITGTITIGANGAVTISNAVGNGCNF